MTESLFARIRWIVWILWAVAAVKLAIDFRQQEDPVVALGDFKLQLSIGVYYVVPFLLLIGGMRGTFDGMSYLRLTLAMLLLGVLCWGIPNLITYGIAQFQGWTHGRFGKDRGPPIGDTTAAKLQATVTIGLFTAVAGFIWSFIWANLVVVLPKKVGGGRAGG